MYWASPFVPAIATLIMLLADGEDRRQLSYIRPHSTIDASCLIGIAEPAFLGAIKDESGRRLPSNIQAAHLLAL